MEKSGFAQSTIERVDVSVGIDSTANFRLATGQVEAEVNVVASGALLETQQSQVSRVIDEKRILELPQGFEYKQPCSPKSGGGPQSEWTARIRLRR